MPPSCALLGGFAIGARVAFYGNIMRTRSVSEYMFVLALCLLLAWLSFWSEVLMIYIYGPADAPVTPIISCFIIIQIGLTFLVCWHTHVVLEKRPLNGCLSACLITNSHSLKTQSFEL